jgi:hypothetical protein
MELKNCPCGKTPESLGVEDTGQGGKWADVVPDCCGEWRIEFRTQYETGNKLYALAVEAWNDVPRFGMFEL